MNKYILYIGIFFTIINGVTIAMNPQDALLAQRRLAEQKRIERERADAEIRMQLNSNKNHIYHSSSASGHMQSAAYWHNANKK